MYRAARVFPPRPFTPPPTLEEAVLCSISYKKATTHCPAYTEYFKPNDEQPSETCDIHRGPTRAERVRATLKRLLDRIGGIFR
jgi:hypothetical protein